MERKSAFMFALAAISVSAAALVAPAQDKARAGGAAMLNALILDGASAIPLRSLTMPLPDSAGKEVQFSTAAVFDPALAGWVQELFDQQPRRRSGRASFLNVVLKRGTTVPFSNALISEVVFPGPNRSQTAPAELKVKFNATVGRRSAPVPMAAAPVRSTQKPWHSANFRFRIGELPAQNIQSMSDLAMKAPFSGATVAVFRLPLTDAKQWEARLAPVGGSAAGIAPLDGQVEYLDPDGTVRGVLTFRMLRMAPLSGPPTGQVSAQVTMGGFRWAVPKS